MSKNKSIHKLPAFTLVELTFAMLIGAMVTAGGYLAYEIAENQFRMFQQNREHHLDALSFQAKLQTELANTYLLRKAGNGWVLEFADQSVVEYLLRSGTLIRSGHGQEDVFPYEVRLVELSFDEMLVHAENELANTLSFSAVVNDEPLDFTYRKSYGADLLMKKEVEDGH